MDRESESTSQRRRQLALEHVRDARRIVEEAQPAVAPKPPPTRSRPAPPAPPPPPKATETEPATEQSAAEPTRQPAEDRSEVERLADAVEALSAKYEMEQAAHRQSLQDRIDEQKQHIQTLQRMIDEISVRRD